MSPHSVAPYIEDSLTPVFTKPFPILGASGPPAKTCDQDKVSILYQNITNELTTYSSVFRISIAPGENAHCSRKAGTTTKAFDFVLTTESRILCELGITGAAEGSCKDVGG
jgi:hypothetical protein